jgi:hypothetical protein
MMNESWTIAELAELAADALARLDGRPEHGPDSGPVAGPVRASGRVRDVPNERLIRWYGTVGLVDPPLSRRGRVARYGRRHLLQLVAVKRRQAEGKSLAEIQEELAGVTDEALAAVARIPGLPAAPAPAGGPVPAAGADPGRFWARLPAADVAAAGPHPPDDGPSARLVHGIRLAPGVTLLLDGTDTGPGPADMTAIAEAARPLLRELARRNLGAVGPHYRAEMDNPQMGAGYEH